MKVKIIAGSAGSGKTFFLQETLCRKARRHPEKDYILIVPEQFTLETQRELVQRQQGGTILNIDVLSFQRLAWRVFEELGLQELPILDDMGKNMVLRRVLSECGEELSYFRGDVKKLGFLSELKSLLSEFAQYDIGEAQLARMAESAARRPLLQGKLKDAGKVMRAFQKFREDRFLTAEEILTRLTDCVGRSGIIENSVICFDGFTGFTPVQIKLLEELFFHAAEVYVTVTIDEREKIAAHWDEFELFSMSKKMIVNLRETAKKTGASWELLYTGRSRLCAKRKFQCGDDLSGERSERDDSMRSRLCAKRKFQCGDDLSGERSERDDSIEKYRVPYRFAESRELAHLEHMLFRYPYKKYTEVPEQILLSVNDNPEKEIWAVLNEIRSLTREGGFRYRDIAVITGDIGGYAQVISSCFQKAGIPFFMDYKKNILANPYVEFLRSFLSMLDKDFSYDTVFRHLGNALVPLKKKEKDRMENYVLALGIRGKKRWRNEWKRVYSECGEEELPKLNRLRTELLKRMRPAAGMLGYDLYEDETEIESKKNVNRKRKRTVLDYVQALYTYSTSVFCEEQLLAYEEYFREQGEHTLEREYAQVYKKIMELLERMADLLGSEVVTLREFMELFDAGIAEVKIGLIPPGLDQVIVGDLERTRLNHLKVLFFIGLNDGIVPKAGGKGGILSELEREYLNEQNFELAPTQRELGFRTQFYLYLALAKPEKKLYLSYCRRNLSCDALRPSYLLWKIQAVFPKLLEMEGGFEKKAGEELYAYAMSAEHGEAYFLKELRSFGTWDTMPLSWRGMFLYYREKEPEKLRRLLFGAFGGNGTARIPAAVAKQLYGRDLYGSVTRFETYAACHYAHFLSYGLRLRERQEFMLRSLDIGNVIHRALCIFGKKASAGEGGWHGLAQNAGRADTAEEKEKEDRRRKMTKESLAEAFLEDFGETRALLEDSARNHHFLKRIEAMLQRTTEILTYQVGKGSMEPVGYEVKFSEMEAFVQEADGKERLSIPAARIPLSDEEAICLHGQIDRLDRQPVAGFVRVVDYKTGKKEFSLEDVYYGLQMQLMVYLKAGAQAAEQLEGRQGDPAGNAAGAYYYRIEDPFVKKKEPEGNEWRQQLKLDGVSNKRKDMAAAQDMDLVEQGEFAASVRSDVIPFALTSKGEVDARCRGAVGEETLSFMMDYVEDTMVRFGQEILDGEIGRNPYKKTPEDTACRYCNYREMCFPSDLAQQGGFRYLGKGEVPPVSDWRKEKDGKDGNDPGKEIL